MPSLKKKIVLVFCIILVLVFLNTFSRGLIRNTLFKISSAPQKFFWQMGQSVSGFFKTVLTSQSLKKENRELFKQYQIMLKKVAELDALKRENEKLRKALGLGLEKKFRLILAEVQGKDIEQNLILLNRGEQEGVLAGMSVISEGGALVGRVVESHRNFSKVQLISDPDFTFAVEVQAEKEPVLGKARGKGNGEIRLGFLPLNPELKEGALVLTTALDGIFPKGLLVGKVKKVKKSSLEPFQEAVAETFFKRDFPYSLFIINAAD